MLIESSIKIFANITIFLNYYCPQYLCSSFGSNTCSVKIQIKIKPNGDFIFLHFCTPNSKSFQKIWNLCLMQDLDFLFSARTRVQEISSLLVFLLILSSLIDELRETG